ncbi:GTP 3',8-cyclase MoaA [Magnetovibrio sp. PR-2]|uniref:GTP 3',8-cyclase MoaA n=1 Tax=Magnetovibrio sp. PR-2 TaxID=3120356 RepID=UPI002FCE560B
MQDTFGRPITYLRVSVTDRCDFRCFYCMAESMTFLPRKDLLSLEELDTVCSTFIERGVKKLRLTGGEPLVRRGILGLIEKLGRHLDTGLLEELVMTTNGSQLAKYAHDLKRLGMKRINVSMDSLDPDKFAEITRRGDINQVLDGLKAAQDADLKVKINTVALKNFNEDELSDMVGWCGEQGFDMTLIETMPLGDIGGDRTQQYLPLSDVRQKLEADWSLIPSTHSTGGPSKYLDVRETGQKVGFITPLSDHFCDNCNRMRLTCTGTLYMCLGQDSSVDLREAMRSCDPMGKLNGAIDQALHLKPKGHEFVIEPGHGEPAVKRHMSVTGG